MRTIIKIIVFPYYFILFMLFAVTSICMLFPLIYFDGFELDLIKKAVSDIKDINSSINDLNSNIKNDNE